MLLARPRKQQVLVFHIEPPLWFPESAGAAAQLKEEVLVSLDLPPASIMR